jgi:hypothetical protein
MKKFDEVQNYLGVKREVFKQILASIDEAHRSGATKIYVKGVKIMEETVDAVAQKSEWPVCIKKALTFFESTEDYESCQECVTLLDKITKKI